MMRLMPSSSAVPAAANKYLLPDESTVVTARSHPAQLIPAAATTACGVLAVVAVMPVLQGNRLLELSAWLIEGSFAVQLAVQVRSWLTRCLVITRQRLFLIDGDDIRYNIYLGEVRNFRVLRSVPGRIAGYGTVAFNVKHEPGSYMIYYMPDPDQIYLEIMDWLFGPRPEDDLDK